MTRLYQISLPTILEVVFVAAVVSAFIYWRNLPQVPAGRYQVQVIPSGALIYIDTATGQLWFGNISADDKDDWSPIAPPVDVTK